MNRIFRLRLFTCLLLAASMLLSLAACGGGNYREDLAASDVLDTVKAAATEGDDYRDTSSGYINGSAWGEDYQAFLDSLTDYRIILHKDPTKCSDEIGVFRVRDEGDNIKRATTVVKDYLKAQTLSLGEQLPLYNPDELPKLDNAKVTVCGRYILYTILDEEATVEAHDAFEKALAAE